jgi:hypothetical protein
LEKVKKAVDKIRAMRYHNQADCENKVLTRK